MTPLLVYTIPSLLPFFVALHLRRYSADFDLLYRGCKFCIEREGVAELNISTWRMLLEDLELGAR